MMTTVFLKSMVRPTVSQPAIIDNLQEEVDNDNDREQRTGICNDVHVLCAFSPIPSF